MSYNDYNLTFNNGTVIIDLPIITHAGFPYHIVGAYPKFSLIELESDGVTEVNEWDVSFMANSTEKIPKNKYVTSFYSATNDASDVVYTTDNPRDSLLTDDEFYILNYKDSQYTKPLIIENLKPNTNYKIELILIDFTYLASLDSDEISIYEEDDDETENINNSQYFNFTTPIYNAWENIPLTFCEDSVILNIKPLMEVNAFHTFAVYPQFSLIELATDGTTEENEWNISFNSNQNNLEPQNQYITSFYSATNYNDDSDIVYTTDNPRDSLLDNSSLYVLDYKNSSYVKPLIIENLQPNTNYKIKLVDVNYAYMPDLDTNEVSLNQGDPNEIQRINNSEYIFFTAPADAPLCKNRGAYVIAPIFPSLLPGDPVSNPLPNPLKIYSAKAGEVKNLMLVDITDPKATNYRIKTPAGIKALKDYKAK